MSETTDRMTESEQALLEAFTSCVARLGGKLPHHGELRFIIRNGQVDKKAAKVLTHVENHVNFTSIVGKPDSN